MNRYASRLVDHNHTVRLRYDTDGLCCYWRFMSMQRVADDIAVLDNGMHVLARLAVDDDLPSLDGGAVVLAGPVAELGSEDIEDLASTPALLAERVVGEMIRGNAAKAV
jgi:hypothetical protein